MTYKNAVSFLNAQDRNLRKMNNTRFIHNGYEYRLMYRGGFAAYVAIDRRKVGKRNFKYYDGMSVYQCWTAEEAIDRVKQSVGVK